MVAISPKSPLLLAFLLASLPAFSQKLTVKLTSVPVFGETGELRGQLSLAAPAGAQIYAFVFIPDVGWTLPSCQALTVTSNGAFSVPLASALERYATRFSVYLVPATVRPTCGNAAAIPPEVERAAIASATLPRLPVLKTLRFSGLDWFIKAPPAKVGPGPQLFSENNAFVDAQGRLHLKVTRCGNEWCAAEIFTKERVGYGSYSFAIEGAVHDLDRNLTLGFFAWDETAVPQNHREWDVEFSRWGDASATTNAQYVVQPATVGGNIRRFTMTAATASVSQVTWTPTQMQFSTGEASGGSPIAQWTYSGGVPDVGAARLHLNLYVNTGSAPANGNEREVILTRANYTPATSQVGFDRISAELPAAATSGTALLVGGAGCPAVVESDSPWLTVVGPAKWNVGSAVQYQVEANPTGPRVGHLILTGESCTLSVDKQVFTVNQTGLICDPSFAVAGTSVGYLSTTRTVAVRGSASTCGWTVASSAGWLRVAANNSGTGDGAIEVTAEPNSTGELRRGNLVLSNGKTHVVEQDAAGNVLALAPDVWELCDASPQRFAASWISDQTATELRLTRPDGVLIGRVGNAGTGPLPANLPDGSVIYLVASPESRNPGRVLASARVTVRSSNCTGPLIGPGGVVNAASYSAAGVAPGSLVSVFGVRLSSGTAQALTVPFPDELAGTTVTISGVRCPLSYVSPGQINLIVPATLPAGRHRLVIGTASAEVLVTRTAGGLFTLNGRGTGTPIVAVTGVTNDGETRAIPAYVCTATCAPTAIRLGPGVAQLYLVLYGTGFRNFSSATAFVGEYEAEVLYAGPAEGFPGVDQVNLRILSPPAFRGQQRLRMITDGRDANLVDLLFEAGAQP